MRLISREVDHGSLLQLKCLVMLLPSQNCAMQMMLFYFLRPRCLNQPISRSAQRNIVHGLGRKLMQRNLEFFLLKGVSQQFLNQIKACWGLNRLPPNSKYLGVPLFFTSSRCKDLQPVKERLENKLSGWKSKNLSWSGRATLIKSVAQTIPAYHMSTIQFPKALCEQLDGVIRRFWWNPKS